MPISSSGLYFFTSIFPIFIIFIIIVSEVGMAKAYSGVLLPIDVASSDRGHNVDMALAKLVRQGKFCKIAQITLHCSFTY